MLNLLSRFIEVPVSTQESEQSCNCALILPLSRISIFDFRIVQTVWYICYACIWTHVTSLTCVLGAMISIFDFGIVLTGWYVFVFHLSITENTLGEIFEEIT